LPVFVCFYQFFSTVLAKILFAVAKTQPWITLYMYSKSLLFAFIFKHWRAPRRTWENVKTVLGSPGIFC